LGRKASPSENILDISCEDVKIEKIMPTKHCISSV